MCYSAQVVADYRRYVRDYRSSLSIKDFYDIFYRRLADPKIRIPKAVEAIFEGAVPEDDGGIKALIDKFKAEQAARFEQEIFAQRKRLAGAERTLASKPTEKAREDQRIATDKVGQRLKWLDDLRRHELLDRDARIFPGWYVPLIVWEDGRRVVKPMRYGCRPAGKPAWYDRKFPGTYNARRDNLEGFWKGLFGHSHGILIVNAFFENVDRHRAEGRELRPGEKPENKILEFRPRPAQDMLVACLWSRWTGPEEPELLSCAAITDDPPAEVAAAGHDRCIIPIKPEHVDRWLQPDARNLQGLYEILDDRARPYYEHRLAA
ncbi:MAG: SOS response-associated peptidase family protein [Rubrivivax sp.]